MRKPKVSVIMSVYNESLYLREAVESILLQTFTDFEFLITDDGSEESVYGILKEYEESDQRVRIFRHEKNMGLPVSLNEMIQKARGDYIARMDADDISLKNRLEAEVSTMKKYHADLVFCGTYLMTSEGKVLCESWRPKKTGTIRKMLFTHNYIPHPTVMARRSILLENRYDPAYRRGQDTELWKRLSAKNIRFYYLEKVLLKYRLKPKIDDKYYYSNCCIENHNKKMAAVYARQVKDMRLRFMLYFKIVMPFFVLRIHGMMKKRI